MRRWLVASVLGLAAICLLTPAAWRGADRGDDALCAAAHAGRASGLAGHLAGRQHGRVGHRGPSARASACPPGAAWWKGAPFRISRAALAKKKENFDKRATLDPETRCYLPGVPRITYMPYPFQIVQQADKVSILYEYLHAIRYIYMNGNPHPRRPDRLVDGRLARPLGGQHAGRRRDPFQRPAPGSTGPGISTATPCTSSNATRRPAPITCSTRSRSRTRRCSRGRGR